MTDLLLWAVPLLPAAVGGLLLAAAPGAQRGRGGLGRLADGAAVLAAAGVLVLSVGAWAARPATSIAWLPDLSLHLSAAGVAGPLAVLVAAVSLAVFVYAGFFLERGEARERFFGFLVLFLAAMELIVLAGDLVVVLIGWELVGACSWALIGFWWRRAEPVSAGSRAFLVTRGADLGLYLAAAATVTGAGLARLPELGALSSAAAAVAAFGVIVAAAGKSAQLPFSGWLSGAMEGPTPVSALLHSAAMVAAGPILLLKTRPLLEAVPWALPAVLWTGVATAVAGAVVALGQSDVKQLLAASTVSQMGYLWAGLGAAGFAAAGAHLANHAAFKALLFLGAGVVVHQGMHRFADMGGLVRRMPWTATLFAAGGLSLAAVPPLGGFFSKDALLAELEHGHLAAMVVLLGATVLTAAYAARAWLGAFLGRARSAEAWAAEEAGPGMLAPMALLAAGAVGLGLLALPPGETWWARSLAVPETGPFSWWTAVLSFVLALAGVGWAVRNHRWRGAFAEGSPLPQTLRPPAEAWLGLVASADAAGRGVVRLACALDRLEPGRPARAVVRLARVLDRIEHGRPARAVERGLRAGAVGVAGFDRAAWSRVTRGGVADVVLRLAGWLAEFDVHALARASLEGAARAGRRLAGWTFGSDRRGLDRAIGALTQGFRATAQGLTRLQTGLVHQYYALAAAGVALLLVYAFVVLGR